jgi:drug/metabolite transporter (DMT)-like permease
MSSSDRSAAQDLRNEGNDRPEHLKGALFLVAAALCWSFGGLWIKLVQLNSLAVAGARSAVAAAVILMLTRKFPRRITRQHLLGAVAYAGTVICFVMATKSTTAANAILLQYTAPVYVALLSSRMLDERVTGIDWASIVVVLAGMTLFMIDGLSGGGLTGDLLAIISGVFFALNVIVLRRERHASPIEMVLLGNIAAAVIGFPFMIGGPAPTSADLLYLLLLGIFQLGLGYFLFVRGVRHVPAIEGALIPVLEPILNPVWVAVFQGERPSGLAVAGGVVVIGAVTLRGVIQTARHREMEVPMGE